MYRKITSILTNLVLLAGIFIASLIVAPAASAWTGTLPTCPNFSNAWIKTIKSNPYFGPNTSWVAYRSGDPAWQQDNVVVFWDTYGSAGQKPGIRFHGDGTGSSINTLEYDANSVPYWVNLPGTESGYMHNRQTWGDLHYGTLLSNISCINDVHNVSYEGWGEKPHFRDSTVEWTALVPPSATYVALGDSFSSGEGVEPFDPASNSLPPNNEDRCHRSTRAYPRLLVKDSSLQLGDVAFVACSGATTSDVKYSGQWDEPAQIDTLSASTKVVTLSIGGNDVGFGDYLLGCIPGCGKGSLIYQAFMNNIHADAFKNNLATTYETILRKAPNAHLYVVGYPYLTSPTAKNCNLLDVSGARAVQVELNSTISKAVTVARNAALGNKGRITYINPNAGGSPFANRYVCSRTSFFNGLDLAHKEYSFHPNVAGQNAYAEVIKAAMLKK